jgi:hypothetical protein
VDAAASLAVSRSPSTVSHGASGTLHKMAQESWLFDRPSRCAVSGRARRCRRGSRGGLARGPGWHFRPLDRVHSAAERTLSGYKELSSEAESR